MEAIDQQWPHSASAFIDARASPGLDTMLCSLSPPSSLNCQRTVTGRPRRPDLLRATPMLHNLCFKKRY